MPEKGELRISVGGNRCPFSVCMLPTRLPSETVTFALHWVDVTPYKSSTQPPVCKRLGGISIGVFSLPTVRPASVHKTHVYSRWLKLQRQFHKGAVSIRITASGSRRLLSGLSNAGISPSCQLNIQSLSRHSGRTSRHGENIVGKTTPTTCERIPA